MYILIDILVERKSAILADALASHGDVLRGSSRIPVPLTTLVGQERVTNSERLRGRLLMPQQVRRNLDARIWKGLSTAICSGNPVCCPSYWPKIKEKIIIIFEEKKLENPGIDPGTSRMLSERSTIWANPPETLEVRFSCCLEVFCFYAGILNHGYCYWLEYIVKTV